MKRLAVNCGSAECTPPETFVLRNKQGKEMTFRNPVNVAEMVNWCNSQYHVWFKALDGMARQAEVTGTVRTWKRDANRIEVPLKFGMYEYGTFDASDIHRILIPV